MAALSVYLVALITRDRVYISAMLFESRNGLQNEGRRLHAPAIFFGLVGLVWAGLRDRVIGDK